MKDQICAPKPEHNRVNEGLTAVIAARTILPGAVALGAVCLRAVLPGARRLGAVRLRAFLLGAAIVAAIIAATLAASAIYIREFRVAEITHLLGPCFKTPLLYCAGDETKLN